MSRTPTFLLLTALLFAHSPSARAANEADLSKPYNLKIVVHLAPHPSLTSVFGTKLRREIEDGLQAALGSAVTVEVVSNHPALGVILNKGMHTALDSWRERQDVKTHFVLVDFDGTDYILETRQYDGWTGQPSPVVRRHTTRDRAYVARLVALMIDRDFGVSGIVQSEPDDKGLVQVRLRGTGLSIPWEEWIRAGDVFALVNDRGRESYQDPWTVLQVEQPPKAGSKDGMCTCRLYSRYEFRAVTGSPCFKLGTRRGPLKIRLVKRLRGVNKLEPLNISHQIQVRHRGFTNNDGANMIRGTTNSNDAFDTASRGKAGIFDNVAFVTILKGSLKRAQMPIPLLDSKEVVIPITPTVTASDDPLRILKSVWRRDVLDAYLRQSVLFQRITFLAKQSDRRAEALQAVREALERTRTDYAKLSDAKQKFLTQTGALPSELVKTNELLEKLKDAEPELKAFLESLEEIERQENDPRRKKAKTLLLQAKHLTEKGELGGAIELLKQIPKDIDTDAVKKQIADLEALWLPKNDAHKKARTFIYDIWPTLTTEQIAERIDEANAAFETCKSVHDKIGPRKLLEVTNAHGLRLKSELEKLNPAANVEDEKPAKLIEELAPKLADLMRKLEANFKN